MHATAQKDAHTRRARGMPGAHKQERGMRQARASRATTACYLVTKHPIPTHGLIGRQRRTSGMEKNHDTATHTQTMLGDTAAAATSSSVPPPPQWPTPPPFFCLTGPRKREGGGPRVRGSRQRKRPRPTQGRRQGQMHAREEGGPMESGGKGKERRNREGRRRVASCRARNARGEGGTATSHGKHNTTR